MNNRVFIAVLNWGIGHASRSVPVIECVIATGADVVIASSGSAMDYLKDHFPQVNVLEIPDKPVAYHSTGAAIGLLRRSFQQRRINETQKIWMRENVEKLGITHIISDNIYGSIHPGIPAAIITHQIGILSPFFKKRFDSHLAKWLSKFDEVWIPDEPGEDSIAGKMLVNVFFRGNKKFIGRISRFPKGMEDKKDIDLLAVLSGPEPQRTFLERRLVNIFANTPGRHVLVRGLMGGSPLAAVKNVKTYAFLNEGDLAEVMTRASLVICRSGYTSILDLMRLGAKACLIPTPQQPEQKYLAKRMKEKGWFGMASQKDLHPNYSFQNLISKRASSANFENALTDTVERFLRT